ncbi:hypothetical protein AYI68_g2080 [Smittium mucronatum]|uniref:Uncharacterized protein n=1 Tax=Smittium mucronatum TaxID=133383 RepID=A0A1R0H3S3_9FUNG|nr:hypothetical protein AYI68_g2080 [Smittium mucronatum]
MPSYYLFLMYIEPGDSCDYSELLFIQQYLWKGSWTPWLPKHYYAVSNKVKIVSEEAQRSPVLMNLFLFIYK